MAVQINGVLVDPDRRVERGIDIHDGDSFLRIRADDTVRLPGRLHDRLNGVRRWWSDLYR